MIDSGLVLLPLVAGILVFRCTWAGGGVSVRLRSRVYQRRFRAKVIVHRFLIPALLSATLIVVMRPIEWLPSLAFGLLVTVAFMLPVCLYLLFVEFTAPFENSPRSDDTTWEPKHETLNQPRGDGSESDAGIQRQHRSTPEESSLEASKTTNRPNFQLNDNQQVDSNNLSATPAAERWAEHIDLNLGAPVEMNE